MGRLPVMEPAVEANPEVGPALRAAFAATRGIAEGPHPTAPMAMTRHAPAPYPPRRHDGRPEPFRSAAPSGVWATCAPAGPKSSPPALNTAGSPPHGQSLILTARVIRRRNPSSSASSQLAHLSRCHPRPTANPKSWKGHPQ